MEEEYRCKYLLGRIVGKGGFGTVFEGVHAATGTPLAVKYVEKRKVTSWDILDNQKVPLELKLLDQTQQVSNVIRFLDFYEEKHHYVIVMERPLFSRDLFEIISEHHNIPEEIANTYFKQVVETVIACHKLGVIHGDIKAENILIDVLTNEIKLIDFGSGHFSQDDYFTHYEGTI